MGDFGFISKTQEGHAQVDGKFATHVVGHKGTAWPALENVRVGCIDYDHYVARIRLQSIYDYYSVTYGMQNLPLIAVQSTSAVRLIRVETINGKYFNAYIETDNADPVKFLILEKSSDITIPSYFTDHGIAVFNDAGKRVFDSRCEYFNVFDVLTVDGIYHGDIAHTYTEDPYFVLGSFGGQGSNATYNVPKPSMAVKSINGSLVNIDNVAWHNMYITLGCLFGLVSAWEKNIIIVGSPGVHNV